MTDGVITLAIFVHAILDQDIFGVVEGSRRRFKIEAVVLFLISYVFRFVP